MKLSKIAKITNYTENKNLDKKSIVIYSVGYRVGKIIPLSDIKKQTIYKYLILTPKIRGINLTKTIIKNQKNIEKLITGKALPKITIQSLKNMKVKGKRLKLIYFFLSFILKVKSYLKH
ncbi:MAG: Unknown protein [uncultured Campylobacterales bacterium]|uniref:Uncharacterized protein n=1 Tax=uncultured Campylobacterales bacterium TaxID=352960 RepID=A0A6S6SMX4_9BACT|nr:MAG: Unknown protein [uncultured Campylobacterales bacterium]